jgi:hypothetical protein
VKVTGHWVKAAAYWVLVLLLISLGIVAIFSIGLPFFVLGLVLAALWPVRHKRAVFYPTVLGLAAFFVVGFLLIPLGCRTAAVEAGSEPGPVVCDSALGIEYAGRLPYRAPQWPAFLGGLVGGALVAVATNRLINLGQLGDGRNSRHFS